MFKTLLITVFFIGITFVAQPVRANDFSHALQRMDEIIQQMQTLRAEFATLAKNVGQQTPSPSVLGVVSEQKLGDDVRFGATNDDIKRIQKLFATDPTIYPYGVVSGYFGPKTQEAVRMFQSRFGLDTVGVVGPSTRALLEVFFAAYPDEQYPADVLKQGRPKVSKAINHTTAKPASSTVNDVTTPQSVLKSLDVSEEDDEYIVRSYRKDGTRNRDLILYPEDETDLIQLIATKLKISESEVKALIAKTDFDFSKTIAPTADSATEETATVSIEEARVAVYAARRVIRNAELDGENITDADDLYTEARTLFTDARKALTKNDYLEAIDLAQNALDLANEAQDIL